MQSYNKRVISYKDRVTAMYQQYAPEKLAQLDTVMGKYAGNEQSLIDALVTKYGPEPSPKAEGDARSRVTAIYQQYAPDKLG